MRLLVTIIALILIAGLKTNAQQIPNLMHYYENPSFINPSFAGNTGYSEAYLLYKKLLVGVPGTFETQLFNVHTYLPKYKLGLGFKINNDVNNFLGHTRSSFDISYKITLNQYNSISFGLSPTVSFHRIHFDRLKAENPYEPIILERGENTSIFDTDFGFNYRNRYLTIGFAAIQLLNQNALLQTEEKNKNIYYRHVRHFHFGMQYRYSLGATPWAFEPGVFVFSPQGQESLISASAKAYFKDVAWVSGHYLHETSVGIKTGIRIDDQFLLSYFFEMPTTQLQKLGHLSHEIMIGFQFGKTKREAVKQKAVTKLARVRKKNADDEFIEKLVENDTLSFSDLQEKISQLKVTQQEQYDEINAGSSFAPADTRQIKNFIEEELNKYRRENSDNLKEIESIEAMADSLPANNDIHREIYKLRQENLLQSKLIDELISRSDSMAMNMAVYEQNLKNLELVIRDIQLSLKDTLSPVNINSNAYKVIGGFKTLKYAKIFQREVKRKFSINSAVTNVYKDENEYFIVHAVNNELLQDNQEDIEMYMRRIQLYEVHNFEPDRYKE